MNIHDYVAKHTQQGECICGKCLPIPDAGTSKFYMQQGRHTINMEFFKVAIVGEPNKDEYLKLMAEHKGHHCDCNPIDGGEHGYMELGGWIGDQGEAMCFMALGVHLGVFKLLTPNTVMPHLPDDLKKQMIGAGLVCVQKAA